MLLSEEITQKIFEMENILPISVLCGEGFQHTVLY